MDKDRIEMLRMLGTRMGLPQEMIEKIQKEDEAHKKEIEAIRKRLAMQAQARAHKPTADRPFTLGGAVSVKHVKEILDYLPDGMMINLEEPEILILMNELHNAAREHIVQQALLAMNKPDEDMWEL